MDLLKQLNWRYAAKRMNGKKVDDGKIDNILEAIRLAASSMGLQPYNILVIKDEALLKKIHQEACKQPQIIECSHLLVFTAWSTMTEKHMDDYIADIAQQRGVTVESLAAFKGNYMNGIFPRAAEKNFDWAARQAYIALGFALVAAAAEDVDSTPMEGFNATALDALLKLKEKGLQSLALLPLGYRDAENDYLVNAKKVRRAKEHLFIEITDTSLS